MIFSALWLQDFIVDFKRNFRQFVVAVSELGIKVYVAIMHFTNRTEIPRTEEGAVWQLFGSAKRLSTQGPGQNIIKIMSFRSFSRVGLITVFDCPAPS